MDYLLYTSESLKTSKYWILLIYLDSLQIIY